MAHPDDDSTFAGWHVSGSSACSAGSTVCRFTLDSDIHVTAKFGAKTYELTVNDQQPDEGGTTGGNEGINCGIQAAETVFTNCHAVERAHHYGATRSQSLRRARA